MFHIPIKLYWKLHEELLEEDSSFITRQDVSGSLGHALQSSSESSLLYTSVDQHLASARSSSGLKWLPFVSRCIEGVNRKTKRENTLQKPPKGCFVGVWLVVLDTESERGGMILLWCLYMHPILAGWRLHMDTRHNLTCVFIWLFE